MTSTLNMQTFTLRTAIPTLNEYIAAERTHRHKAAALKRTVEAALAAECRAQGARPVVEYPVTMQYVFYRPDRRTDKSNIIATGLKFIEDALQKAKVLRNDGWREIGHIAPDVICDRGLKRPHVELTIIEGA